HGGPGGGLLQGLPHVARGAVDVPVDGPAEEGFLVAERGIEARTVDTHGLGEVAQGGAFVTLLPEDLQGGVHGLLRVERPRPPRAPRRHPRPFHTARYIISLDAPERGDRFLYRRIQNRPPRGR